MLKKVMLYGSFALCWTAVSCRFMVAAEPLEVRGGIKQRIDNAPAITQIGDTIYLSADEKLSTTMVAVFRVLTEASSVAVEVSNDKREPYEPKKVSADTWEISDPGKWWIDVTAIDFAKQLYGKKSITLELGNPGPKPPTPPDPSPTPVPIDGEGLRVLFVVESAEAAKLPKGQQDILYGTAIRDILNRYCAKGNDGKTPDWRILDADTKYADANDRWSKALSRPRQALPWVVISNGVTGFEGPLPATAADFELLLDAYLLPAMQVAKSATRVVLISKDNCVYCDQWKLTEAKHVCVPWVEEKRSAAKYPTFIVEVNGKQSTLEGYQSAATLNAEVKRLGGQR